MTRNHTIIGLVLGGVAMAVSLILYSQLPDTVPTRFGFDSEVLAEGDKSWAAFLMPVIMLALVGVMGLLKRWSPKRFEVESFNATYSLIGLLTIGFLGFIQGIILWRSLDPNVEMIRILMSGILVFFIFMGNYMGKVRRNFWMGIRTPWALANEKVWNYTHRLAAWTFVIAGVIGLIAMLLDLPATVAFGLLMIAVIIPAVFSFVEYKRLDRNGEL
jgi:uncharacterized membrane protein